MKALVLESYHHLEYKEVEMPVPASDEVLIRVKAAGACGSDVPVRFPLLPKPGADLDGRIVNS